MTKVKQKPGEVKQKPYYVYILRCQDDSLYTGITTDLERRLKEHKGKDVGDNSETAKVTKKGAKYTASRKVLRYEVAWTVPDRSNALKLELKIKSLSKKDKENLISGKDSLNGVYNSQEFELS